MKMRHTKTAYLLYGATGFGAAQFSADILWRTKFKAADPFALVEIDGKTYLFVSALEFSRAKKEARADHVILFQNHKTVAQDIASFLKQENAKEVVVPETIDYALADALKNECGVLTQPSPFYRERLKKSDWEISEIENAQRAVERAVEAAVELLASAEIRGGHIVHRGEVVTSEILRSMIDHALHRDGYLGIDTIVSSGIEAADPHARGSGPLAPHAPIVIDVFPCSMETHYYADQTRTFFKGKPPNELIAMYETVRVAQEDAIGTVKAGVNGKNICNQVLEFFESKGYPTRMTGTPEGFFHGLGHGVGVEIHEPPRMSATNELLEEGTVITVEPGLYYTHARRHIPRGGIRIEDMVVVGQNGSRNLTRFRKDLQSMILK